MKKKVRPSTRKRNRPEIVKIVLDNAFIENTLMNGQHKIIEARLMCWDRHTLQISFLAVRTEKKERSRWKIVRRMK